jgi:hypothetical protein
MKFGIADAWVIVSNVGALNSIVLF